VQITAPALDEGAVFRAAHALEAALSLDLRPPILADA
jgi:Asp-tRNA(Asn)/Glu-tRNA(Gln) amidotransferase A subunit family amidase